MSTQLLRVVRLETWPDGSVNLVLENGHEVSVRRLRSESVVSIDRASTFTPDEKHELDVTTLPTEGSAAFV